MSGSSAVGQDTDPPPGPMRTMPLNRIRAGVLVALSVTLAAAAAPRGTLRGRLLDQASERPIPGAAVTLIVARETRITDIQGRFDFGDLDVRGPDTLVIRHLAYDSLRLALESAEDLGPLDLELLVAPRPIVLDGLAVEVDRRARAEARYLADVSGGFLWEHEEFERYAMTARHPVDVLRWSGRVALVTEGADDYRCVEIRLRWGCALILLNNVFVNDDVFKTIPAIDIESIVLIDPIHASTLYGTGAGGGVVVLYTRAR